MIHSTANKDAVYQAVLDLTCTLMRAPSITPEDAGCQALLADELAALGFTIEYFNAGGVTNLWASRSANAQSGADPGPHLVFAGHTDVVPPGPRDAWQSDPFEPVVRDGCLFGRGAADMKSSLAAMLVAARTALHHTPDLTGTLSFLITSDEEGDAIHGTRHVVSALDARGVCPDFCIVGEPSSSTALGDVVRCGRRGSLNGRLIVRGVQGHVAYPDDAVNPIHKALHALAELAGREWDQGDDYYPATSFQMSNIHAGTGVTNVIPGSLEVMFNFRFNTRQHVAGLREAVASALAGHGLDFELTWQHSGDPFITPAGRLTGVVTDAIRAETGLETTLSTSGGTSDGRFIAPWNQPGAQRVQVVELGPTNATIHKVDECVGLDQLEPLARIYQRIIHTLLDP